MSKQHSFGGTVLVSVSIFSGDVILFIAKRGQFLAHIMRHAFFPLIQRQASDYIQVIEIGFTLRFVMVGCTITTIKKITC